MRTCVHKHTHVSCSKCNTLGVAKNDIATPKPTISLKVIYLRLTKSAMKWIYQTYGVSWLGASRKNSIKRSLQSNSKCSTKSAPPLGNSPCVTDGNPIDSAPNCNDLMLHPCWGTNCIEAFKMAARSIPPSLSFSPVD